MAIIFLHQSNAQRERRKRKTGSDDKMNATIEITRQALDAGKIVHAGWTPSRDTADQCGVNVLDFFDASGKFLGADENGVEPIFETC
jgi:hypothetical protein